MSIRPETGLCPGTALPPKASVGTARYGSSRKHGSSASPEAEAVGGYGQMRQPVSAKPGCDIDPVAEGHHADAHALILWIARQQGLAIT